MKAGDLVAGRYRLLRPIGAGGMGSVWAARHEVLGRDVAIKFALAGSRTPADVRARFLREAQIVGRLRHPNVVDVADAGALDDGGLYLAMELLEGESLADRLARGPVPVVDALALALELCRGLEAAHAAGVVHRDVKPANVFLARTTAGVIPKLLDFGVGKVGERSRDAPTIDGAICATPAYMSPEQALGEDVDLRTDVWSLGVVLYEAISGAQPFVADSYPALLPRIAESPHRPLADVSTGVRALVDRCLQKAPAERFASAAALRAALEEQLDALGEASTEIATSARLGSQVSVLEAASQPARRRVPTLVVVGAVAVGVAAIALTLARAVPGEPAAGPAAAAAPATAAAATSVAPSAIPSAEVTPPIAPSAAPAAPANANSSAPSATPGPRRPPAPPRGGATARPVTRVDHAGF